MSKEIIKEDIIQLLESIIEQTQTIDAYTGTIPQIELDLIQDNIRQLYQNYVYLNKINQGQIFDTGTVRKAKTQTKEAEESVEEQKKERVQGEVRSEAEPKAEPEKAKTGENKGVSEEPIRKQEQKTDSGIKQEESETEGPAEVMTGSGTGKGDEKQGEGLKQAEPETKKSQPQQKQEAEQEKDAKTQNYAPEKKSRKAKKEKEEATKDLFSQKASTLAEKLQGSGASSLYDRIGIQSKEGTLGERLKKNPVSDIKKAIGINEKFLFINELFNGNMHDYNDAIKRMNRAENLEEAVEVFDEYKEKYDWNTEESAVLQLLNFVERKFQ